MVLEFAFLFDNRLAQTIMPRTDIIQRGDVYCDDGVSNPWLWEWMDFDDKSNPGKRIGLFIRKLKEAGK